MKKLLYLFGAMALMAGMVACGDNNKPDVDLDIDTDPGFYVVGEAVGVTFDMTSGEAPEAATRMANGYNENSLKLDDNGAPTADRGASRLRSGMYEKYVWLEGGKDFELIYYDGDVTYTRYGSALEDNVTNSANDGDFPKELEWGKLGDLVIGEDAPMLRVEESGFYHIVLDDASNVEDKADFALIMVNKVDMGVRGAQNGWGNTYGEMVRANDGTITWTWTEQTLKMGEKFKFAYNHGWKIALDLAGNIKANTNLGWVSADDHGLLQGGPDIVVDAHGIYTITLTYKMAGGDFKNSFTYKMEKTEDLEVTVPDNVYINGNDFGGEGWDWNAPTIVEMARVYGGDAFWAVRYLTTASQFKFCNVKEWKGDFTGLGTNEGYGYADNGNCKVDADGLYLIVVDYEANKIVIKPATGLICGLGDAFGGWDATNGGQVPFTVATDGTVTGTATAAGLLRIFAKLDGVDAWKSEFSVWDGKIVYRGNGGDFSKDNAVEVTAGQTITLNFNAGTATIK